MLWRLTILLLLCPGPPHTLPSEGQHSQLVLLFPPNLITNSLTHIWDHIKGCNQLPFSLRNREGLAQLKLSAFIIHIFQKALWEESVRRKHGKKSKNGGLHGAWDAPLGCLFFTLKVFSKIVMCKTHNDDLINILFVDYIAKLISTSITIIVIIFVVRMLKVFLAHTSSKYNIFNYSQHAVL